MNLHLEREVFVELIVGAANELAIPTNVIEKDYCTIVNRVNTFFKEKYLRTVA